MHILILLKRIDATYNDHGVPDADSCVTETWLGQIWKNSDSVCRCILPDFILELDLDSVFGCFPFFVNSANDVCKVFADRTDRYGSPSLTFIEVIIANDLIILIIAGITSMWSPAKNSKLTFNPLRFLANFVDL